MSRTCADIAQCHHGDTSVPDNFKKLIFGKNRQVPPPFRNVTKSANGMLWGYFRGGKRAELASYKKCSSVLKPLSFAL